MTESITEFTPGNEVALATLQRQHEAEIQRLIKWRDQYFRQAMENGAAFGRLRDAAQAVIDRWDTPLWKDVPATAVYINRLRAVAAGLDPAQLEGCTPGTPDGVSGK